MKARRKNAYLQIFVSIDNTDLKNYKVNIKTECLQRKSKDIYRDYANVCLFKILTNIGGLLLIFTLYFENVAPKEREKKRNQNKSKKTKTQQMASIYKFLFVYILWLIFAFFWAVFFGVIKLSMFFFLWKILFLYFLLLFWTLYWQRSKNMRLSVDPSVRPSVRFPFSRAGCLSVRPFVLLANYLLH